MYVCYTTTNENITRTRRSSDAETQQRLTLAASLASQQTRNVDFVLFQSLVQHRVFKTQFIPYAKYMEK